MKLFTINTGNFKLDGGAMFGVVPKSMWNKLHPADENNMCTWAMRCLLVHDGDRLILIDTGMGNKQDDKFFGHYYLHNTVSLQTALAAHGFTPPDVTDVVLTHLHFDHCGGAIVSENGQLVPAFKNATYWSSERHWQWAINPNAREKASFLRENILPIKESGQLQYIHAEDGAKLTDNIHFKFFFGHTDGMMLPVINYNGKTIVFMADLLPSVAHIPMPYVMAYDMLPLQTLKEKKHFLQEAIEKDFILFLEHDPFYECCTLQQTEKGGRLKDTFALADIL